MIEPIYEGECAGLLGKHFGTVISELQDMPGTLVVVQDPVTPREGEDDEDKDMVVLGPDALAAILEYVRGAV